MKIRKAEISDAEAITKINTDTWQDAYKGILPQEILAQRVYSPERVERWRNHIKKTISGGTAIYVAENDEGKVVGFAWGGVSRDNNIPRNMELYAFYVRPEEQKKGYGLALFEAFKKYAAGNFYAYMLKDNNHADRFYRKMGGITMPEYYKGKERSTPIGIEEICYFF